jgi:hypothetical protein
LLAVSLLQAVPAFEFLYVHHKEFLMKVLFLCTDRHRLHGHCRTGGQALVPAQSAVNFEAKQMGVPLKGHFKKFDAQIAFDAAKPESSKIHFTVDTGSATMGAKETDAELPKADWFNVAKFPQATLTPAPSRLWAVASSRWTAR